MADRAPRWAGTEERQCWDEHSISCAGATQHASAGSARSVSQQAWRRRWRPPFVERDGCHCVGIAGHVLQPTAGGGACTHGQASECTQHEQGSAPCNAWLPQPSCAAMATAAGLRPLSSSFSGRRHVRACAPVSSAWASATSCLARSGRSVRLPANCSMLTPGANQCACLQQAARQLAVNAAPPPA